ncbi:hypothetical protein J4E85_011065 [Alternaria conjuncta]|uniref:uncharacterized protein n=1 Tax=Alternaria conjuncta TaxID=181017 RepID=UPI00221FBE4D|nr:uncharacterized protein J4E85_011065 [Alternaria conjuncta]KAI4912332.1 hypothetical protein J4E85_011065 [Alternaria conjuncta]
MSPATGTAHLKRPYKGGGALKARNRVKEELESEKKPIHQAPDPQFFHNMTTATAHAKVPYVGGGAFTERLLANKALESKRKLRVLMGMLLEAIVSSTQELEADDEDEWENVGDDDEEEWEDVGDDGEWEDVDDDEELEDVDDENDWEDIDDEEDDDLSNDNSSDDSLDFSDPSHSSHPSSNPSIFLSSFLSNNPPTKDYPPIGHLSFATIEEARTAYYSTLSQVENLLVKWYHKDDVTALVKTLIESAQASYAEQEEFWKDRRIVQEWFDGIDE